MLTGLLYSLSVLWAVGAIVALVLCDISARTAQARVRAIKTQRQSRQIPARVAMRGF